ncbi:MAG: ATP-dependent DNA ligase [Gemmatimonadetes bacterium]|uniref:ATP-dependent DNA ligase n=1 Tax=Candidatus Kutchimonas denitrificans TaxID=3056748 RepID=A0AAE5CBP8_9BACT|nr:ATP-dependent DNA ligase [Gemmatimonadota bacterium]NIR76157.1 ATP-dependent DNA ligase [Candidatus Kutchimonas denitrificans]NIS00536.1 ATP-dependent DNA ligase [Gemmatimonadota bacterium]NIT66194.1 ATP-dependent DNA ligase [Gemmatimonadota bacterium]NIU54272.1 ATP-dependent DNA ligase [Gemmatimonadota bacterium]
MSDPRRTYGRNTVELSKLDKVLFPADGLTKGDLIDYYEGVYDVTSPHLENRPLTLQRFPDGIGNDGFYQKETPDYFPDWIDRARIDVKGGGSQEQVLCNKKATLVYLANQACITPHIWLSRADRIERPDRMIFDLDPPGDDFGPVRTAARRFRDLLRDLELEPHLMLTGSSGAHVVVPLRREAEFDEVRKFAQLAADTLARRHPDDLTTEQRKAKRGDRVFLDTARNAYGQTAVAPYSVRARDGAPVATPIDWDELGDSDMHPQRYTIRNLNRRLAQRDDPWAHINRHAVGVGALRESLERLRKEE